MNLATNGWWNRSATKEIRSAEMSDTQAISTLLSKASWKHVHADWRTPLEWIGETSCQIYQSHGRVRGYLAITADPAPIAWIRTLAIQAMSPRKILEELLPPAIEQLQKTDVTHITCLTVNSWLDDALQYMGFEQVESLKTMQRTASPIISVPNSEILIRLATDEDMELLAQIDHLSFPNAMWWHSKDQLLLGKKQSIHFIVAERQGQIVGFAYTTTGGRKSAHLVRITVDPICRGRGVGSSLLIETIRACQEMGYDTMSLNTPMSNQLAHKLYDRYGFSPTGITYPIWQYTL